MNRILLTAILMMIAAGVYAQDVSKSTGVRRRVTDENTASKAKANGVTQRMQLRYEDMPVDDSELQWMRVIYRKLDLTKEKNATLYYPEEVTDGNENLFRIIMGRMVANQLSAYEYLDGKEIFTDEYKVKPADVFDRFHIPYTDAKGSTERNPKYVIEEADVPSTEVLSYYIIERWEFDKRDNRVRTKVEAVCPVLHRAGDFGGEDVRYPMFWVKYDDLRPYLATTSVFTSDDNNLATSTYDDYFRMGLYDGEIYKTRNLRNKSLMELHQDEESLAHAQDSIQRRLDTFEDKLWVPSPEEIAKNDSTTVAAESKSVKKTSSMRSKRGNAYKSKSKAKPAKVKKSKSLKSSSGSVTRSVRNRK